MNPIKITIPAATASGNGIKNYSALGKYFLCTATTGEFLVTTDTGQTYDFSNPGDGFGAGPTFKKLFFQNPGGVAINVTFYASGTPIKTPDANITSTISVTASLTNTLQNCALESEGQNQVSFAGVAIHFAAPGTYFRRALIVAQSSLARAANAGNVYIGIGAANQPITLAPGSVFEIEADTGAKRDLGNWYLSADNDGDGISLIYV